MTVWERQKLFFVDSRSKKLLGSLLLFFVLLMAFSLVSSTQAAAANKTISFSARLRGANGNTVPDGLYNVAFKLYKTSEAGSAIWSETYSDENGTAAGSDYRVKVTNGYLNVRLGSRTTFGTINWNDDLWLTMNIGGTGQFAQAANIPWDGEMSPRIQLGAVPYAMNAGLLGGKSAGDFIQLGQGAQTNASDNPSIHINTTGKGDLVRLERDEQNVLTIDNQGDIIFGNGSDHTIAIDQSDENTDGRTLTITGGDGGEGTSNGGNVVLAGGSGSGNGASGLVVLASTAFATATTDSNCYAEGTLVSESCVLTQSTVDDSSAVIIGFDTPDQTATLPDPTLATPGRILYVMAANDSQPLTLIFNGEESIAMQPKSALTLLWNGSDWIIAGHVGSSGNIPKEPAIVEDEEIPDGGVVIDENEVIPEIAIDNITPETGLEPTAEQPVAPGSTGGNFPFQLGSAPSAPQATPGSMYYDTTLGKVQCYEETGWGSCGDAPDTFVTISPEYTNAVMNGTDIGIISSDFCSGSLGINDGSDAQPEVCAPDETYNFYRWTTQEESDQTRSIYLTYKLPDNFKGFIPESTSIMGRTDSDNARVDYLIYKDTDDGLEACGEPILVSSGEKTHWQTGLAEEGNDPASCDFEASDSILFRINLTAREQTSAYVSNVNFIFRNHN